MIAVMMVSLGCEMPGNPWRFADPPTTVEGNRSLKRVEDPVVVVVGQFRDPDHSPNYPRGVGRWMSESYSRALLNDRRFDVWVNPHLSREVERVLTERQPDMEAALKKLSEQNREVSFVITGKVTDFAHTVDLPSDVARWGVIGRRREAVVAVDLKIVDLRNRRLVGADHLQGVARTGTQDTSELYDNVAIDSYLFWSTPLGRASKRVIGDAVTRTEQVAPRGGHRALRSPERYPRILRQHSPLRVSIQGGSDAGLVSGQEYYVLASGDDGTLTPIYDPDTELPLRVRITTTRRTDAVGLLRGKRPVEVDIRGTVLRRNLSGTATGREALSSAPTDDET